MEIVINLSTKISLLTQELQRRQLVNDQHQKVSRQGWNSCMPMGQVQYVSNPYLNTYDSGFQYHPYLSWETNQDVPQPLQGKESNLEEAMVEMKNSHVQMATFYLEEAMTEMAKSQVELSKSQAQFMNETKVILQIQSNKLKSLEMQIGQMAKVISDK